MKTKGKARGHGLRERLATFSFRRFAWVIHKLRLVNFTVINRKAVSRKGALIVACNHISVFDPIFLWCVFKRPAIALAMAELWTKAAFRWVMNLLKHIPVDRKSPASRAKALEDAAQELHRGRILIIYPQGRCLGQEEDEASVPYQSGVYTLAKMTGAPILAAHISGTNKMAPLRKDRKQGEKAFNRKAPIHLAFATELMYVTEDMTQEEALGTLRHTINSLAPTHS